MALFGKNLSFSSNGIQQFTCYNLNFKDCPIDVFKRIFKKTLYNRILKNLFDRTIFDIYNDDGVLINETEIKKIKKTFFDNPVSSNLNKGLFTFLNDAILNADKMFLEYDNKGTYGIINKIQDKKVIKDLSEGKIIKYKVAFSFEYMKDTNTILDFYLDLLYNLMKSIDVKIIGAKSLIVYLAGLSENVAKGQVDSVNKQVKSLSESINKGSIGVLDSDSKLESGVIDVSGIEKAQDFIMKQISLLLNFSVNFLIGQSTAGMGSSGENDQEKDFKSLSICFNEYWRPIIEQLYNINISLKIDKWQLSEQHKQFIETIEKMALIPIETKQKIITNLLESNGLIDREEGETIQNNKIDYIFTEETIKENINNIQNINNMSYVKNNNLKIKNKK